MARVVHTPDVLGGPYQAAGKKLTWVAADAANKELSVLTGREIVLAWNQDAAVTYTVTITSTADAEGRTKDITAESLLAGEIHAFGPFTQRIGWQQTDGNIYFEANNAKIFFAVVQLP